MELVPVISKEAYLAASIYDLVHVPYSPARSVPYVLYASSLGPLLYVAYRIEKSSLWDKLFSELVGAASTSSEETNAVLNELKAINVYRWNEIAAILTDVSTRVGTLYQSRKDRIVYYMRKVFGFQRLFAKLYVIYGFNPMPSMSFGSVLHFNDESAIIAIYVNDALGECHVLDLIIHELLHGLMRLNKIELEHSIEELVIDISAPQGYLSKLVELVDRVDVRLEDFLYSRHLQQEAERYRYLFNLLVEYYERKMYDKMTIIEWIEMQLRR